MPNTTTIGTGGVASPTDSPPSRLAPAVSLSPSQIAAIYLIFAVFALFLSDLVLLWFLSDPILRQVQAVKGLLEVLLTGGLIYVLTASGQRSLRRSNEELERHREELSVLHRLLRHNLRNDLTLVRGEAERLQECVSEENEDACEAVVSVTDGIIEDADRAQAIRKLTERGRYRFDLAELVPSVADVARPGLGSVRVRTDVPEEAPVTVNECFDRALLELLTNVGNHVDEEATVTVRVERDSDREGTTLVEVSDDGHGLPDHTVAALRGDRHDQLVHMDGLGLWFAYLAVVESGGEFSIVPDADGTTIRMYLPTAPAESPGRIEKLRSALIRG